jgi:cobalt-zinc-cadmium efflux system membrane fusion protein
MRAGSGRRPFGIAAAALLLALGACGDGEGTGDGTAPGAAVPSRATEPSANGSAQEATLCEHGVPGDVCTRCNPDLVAVFKELDDWCDEHGLPESHCRECNPNLDFAARAEPADWCREHGVPESKCTKCNPALVARFIEAGDYCREHGYPQSVCPRCDPSLVTDRGEPLPTVPAPGTKVRLASDETAREAGIQTAPVERRRLAETIEVVGRLVFDQNRLAQLSSAVPATVVEVKVDVGDEVRAGDPLVVLASAAVGEDQSRLAAARARVEMAAAALAREQSLLEKGISARKEVEAARSELAAAQAELQAARASLRVAGASAESTEGRYTLAAPLAGTVVARDAVVGRAVSPEEILVQVADLATMWALLEIPEAESTKVRAGQLVSLRFEGLSGGERQASLSRVGASVDPATRTLRARVDLPNVDRSLKAGLFVRGRIHVSEERDAVLVPREAVQYAEGQPVVFVKDTDSVYLPVPVKLGAETDGRIEILHGLEPGVGVVTTGAFLLKTEILKDSIGAGCCDEGGE